MPQFVHLYVKGQKQGQFQGECEIKTLDREKSIECLSYEHSVEIPFDVHHATPSGRRAYKPIKITKWMDQTSPLFLNACATNERIDVATFKFFRPARTGEEEHFFTVEIKNGYVTSSKQIVHDVMDNQFREYKPMEEITFTFQRIEWTHVTAKKSAMDDWSHAK